MLTTAKIKIKHKFSTWGEGLCGNLCNGNFQPPVECLYLLSPFRLMNLQDSEFLHLMGREDFKDGCSFVVSFDSVGLSIY